MMKTVPLLYFLLITGLIAGTITGCNLGKDEAIPEPERSTEEFLEIDGKRIPIDNITSKEVFRSQGRYSLVVRFKDENHMMFTHSENNYREGNHLLRPTVTDTTVTINNYIKKGLKYHQYTTNDFYSMDQYEMYRSDGVYVSEFKNLRMFCAIHVTPPDTPVLMSGRLVWKFKN